MVVVVDAEAWAGQKLLNGYGGNFNLGLSALLIEFCRSQPVGLRVTAVTSHRKPVPQFVMLLLTHGLHISCPEGSSGSHTVSGGGEQQQKEHSGMSTRGGN